MRDDSPGWLAVEDDFEAVLDPRWSRMAVGGGTVATGNSRLRLALPGATRGVYSDAQIDDYTGLRAARYRWRPPLRMEVVARASHPAAPSVPATPDVGEFDSPSPRGGGSWGVRSAPPEDGQQRFLRGTAGFGFWNYPLTRAGGVPRLPNSVWFFGASPPSNMALVPGVPGWGWKAQVIHAHRWRTLALALPTAGAVGWARLRGREEAAARHVRRFAGASEALLTIDLSEWHTYTLEWRAERAEFWVDGAQVLTAPAPPAGPLGFVAWIDNQYAVATPRGSFGFGTLASGAEWLELDALRITPL